nr:cyclic nucleotide-gated cation channel beta-1-like [Arachis hypogaea]
MEMATHITFVYHHRGWLEKDADGVLKYNGGLVSIIERVTGLRRDADVVKMCDAALRNENSVHLYFEHPVDADPEYVDEAEVLANEDVDMPPLEDQQNHDQEPQKNEEEEGSEHTEVEGVPLLNEANEQDDSPQHEEQQQEEDEPTLNNGGYDEALPEEAGTENLSNQTEVGTIENEAPNLGDNQQTHVEDHERLSNPEEVDGRGRKRRKKHARPPPSGRDQPAPQNNSDAHAAEEDEDAQQAPEAGQPATGGIVPPRGLQDMSDSEQEMFWEETMDAVEEELTQGHPQSEADEKANMNTSGATTHGEGGRAARSNPARRAPRSKTPSNAAAAAAASTSKERSRVKMPIRRHPLAQPSMRPISTAPIAQPNVRPIAPGPSTTPRPNPPFRPPRIRLVAPSTNAAAGSGVSDSTRTPLVSNETMNGASKATTSRFSKFMPNQST